MYYTQNIDSSWQLWSQNGDDKTALQSSKAVIKKASSKLKAEYRAAKLPMLNAAQERNFKWQDAAKSMQSYQKILILGMGGSTLNPQLLSALSSAPDKIIYWENIDPRAFTNLCQSLDITRTAVLVITKSGKTIETVAQFLALFDFWRRIVVKPQKHFWFITDPEPNPMRDLATQLGIECLEHPQEIGGRYATFTVVGLLPAYLADLDVAAFLTGAKTVLNNWLNQEESDPESGALFQFHGMLLNHSMTVFMPYIASLYALSNWFCQLWSESLGKGGQGTTPIRASGPLDQHSQLQLYLDGPNDKIFTFITEHHTHTKNIISPNLAGADSLTQLLAKTSLGALVEAEQEATIATVARHSRPVRVIALNQLKEAELGSLCMHIMLETLIVAEAMGVDPFSQPAVEEGKRLALEALNNRV